MEKTIVGRDVASIMSNHDALHSRDISRPRRRCVGNGLSDNPEATNAAAPVQNLVLAGN